MKENFINYYQRNDRKGVDKLMESLNPQVTLIETKMIDFYLGLMDSKESISQVEFYLFHGTQIQRNYSTLFLARKNIWRPINAAYEKGLIDYKQAYSR